MPGRHTVKTTVSVGKKGTERDGGKEKGHAFIFNQWDGRLFDG